MFAEARNEGEGSRCGGHHHMGFGMRQGPMYSAFCGRGQGMSRSFIRPVVLLLLAEQPQHGYELMSKMKEFGIGQGGMDPSILYRLLRHLEGSGLAESSLDDTGPGPARKVYGLTPEGREVLDLWAANLEEFSAFLEEFKKRYRKLTG